MDRLKREWRVGSVAYLNARPLVETLGERVEFAVPSALSRRYAAGDFDAALVPVFAVLERGGGDIADGVAIACDGEVFSVFLAYRGELGAVRSIAMDPASRTSVNLLRCILRGFRGMDFAETADVVGENQARLVIGDPAIAFRATAGAGWRILDLGAEWKRLTGLPFVFAAWALGGNFAELAELLRRAKRDGIERIDEIASREDDQSFTRDYLTRFIRYDLGVAEKEAVAVFAAKCRELGLLDSDGSLPAYR